jgi:hypothetical protein
MKYYFTPILVLFFIIISATVSMGQFAVGDSIGIYDDHNTTFRVMWDDDYYYVFVQVVDDEIDGSEKANPWESDCIELFFDGGNEKAADGYDENDIQWRYVYGEEVGDTSNAGNGPGDWAWMDTPVGYNFEVRIPQDSLTFDLEADAEIGFEISNADRDAGRREDVLHWWTTDGTTWNNPSLFGTAILSSDEVSDVINIPFAESAPDIDGDFELSEGWEYAHELSLTKLEGDAAPDTIWTRWTDHMTSYYTLWDQDNFYVFVKVIDEERDGSEKSNPWESDCVELFFDGGNEKAADGYDENDIQWRYVYGEIAGDTSNAGNGPGDFVFKDTEMGYNLEISIPQDSLTFDLVADAEIGFEISNADRDNGFRNDVIHWWTTDGTTWNNPSLFGTALLASSESISEEDLLKTAYTLEQPAIDGELDAVWNSVTANPALLFEGGIVNSIGDDHSVVRSFNLGQNYPNPFNPTTTIAYSLDKAQNVRLVVYDILGQEISVLVDGLKTAGQHKIEFNGSNLPSGIYFYRMEAGSQVFTNKMMLIK